MVRSIRHIVSEKKGAKNVLLKGLHIGSIFSTAVTTIFSILIFIILFSPTPIAKPHDFLQLFALLLLMAIVTFIQIGLGVRHIKSPKLWHIWSIIIGVIFYIEIFAVLYSIFGLYQTECPGSANSCGEITHSGIEALYFSTVTITTTGYGDFIPANNYVRAFAGLEMLSGYGILALLIAFVSELFRSQHEEKK